MSNLSNLKTEIKKTLESLMPETIKELQVDDFSKRLTERDIAKYPAAILTSPQIESSFFTNAEHQRTYTFVILILEKADNVKGAGEIETQQRET
jgi:hypothetical protein